MRLRPDIHLEQLVSSCQSESNVPEVVDLPGQRLRSEKEMAFLLVHVCFLIFLAEREVGRQLLFDTGQPVLSDIYPVCVQEKDTVCLVCTGQCNSHCYYCSFYSVARSYMIIIRTYSPKKNLHSVPTTSFRERNSVFVCRCMFSFFLDEREVSEAALLRYRAARLE